MRTLLIVLFCPSSHIDWLRICTDSNAMPGPHVIDCFVFFLTSHIDWLRIFADSNSTVYYSRSRYTPAGFS